MRKLFAQCPQLFNFQVMSSSTLEMKIATTLQQSGSARPLHNTWGSRTPQRHCLLSKTQILSATLLTATSSTAHWSSTRMAPIMGSATITTSVSARAQPLPRIPHLFAVSTCMQPCYDKQWRFFCAECLIEENTSFYGNDLNDGHPKQNDVESCRSHCRSTYPTAKYFEWVGPSSFWSPSSWWVPNTCWCKDSDSGRKKRDGSTSGEVTCGNDGDDIDEDNTDGEVLLTSNSK